MSSSRSRRQQRQRNQQRRQKGRAASTAVAKQDRKVAGAGNQPTQTPLPLPLDLTGISVTETKVASFSGPIPHPEVLSGYESLVPGAADRIISMAEREQEYRHRIVEKAVDANVARDRRGQWMGFAIATVGLLISALVIYYGRDHTAAVVGGTVLGGADFVALVALFVRQQKDDDPPASE